MRTATIVITVAGLAVHALIGCWAHRQVCVRCAMEPTAVELAQQAADTSHEPGEHDDSGRCPCSCGEMNCAFAASPPRAPLPAPWDMLAWAASDLTAVHDPGAGLVAPLGFSDEAAPRPLALFLLHQALVI
jgi:hypothetical protein